MESIRLNATDTTYVSEAFKKQNFYYFDHLNIGYASGAQCLLPCDAEKEALLKFGELSLLPQDCRIANAALYLYVTASVGGQYDRGMVGVFKNREDFCGKTVNWCSRPHIRNHPAGIMHSSRPDLPGYVSCNITGLAAEWAQNKETNFGVTLRADAVYRQYVRACSMHSAHPPYVLIEYSSWHPECMVKNEFTEQVFDLQGSGEEGFSPAVKTAQAQTATFFIKNLSDAVLNANLQISPDGADFVNDMQVLMIPSGDTGVLTPYYFAKYCRARLCGGGEHGPAAKIWCQMQTRNYYMH